MKIDTNMAVTGNGTVLSGHYAYTLSGGLKLRLFELSSPKFPVDSFSPPYDAVLPDPVSGFLGVGTRIKSVSDTIDTDRSGAFYFYDVPTLYGVCHGFGRSNITYYSGFNFYNAFYPGGYFVPPFGETPSLFKLNKDEYANLQQGSCTPLNITEYNEQFGIVSRVAPDVGITTQTLTPGALAQIMSLRETCPESTVAVQTYYDEVQLTRIAGTASSITAPTLHNHNATPTALDSYDIWTEGRYKYTGNDDTKQNFILTGSDGRPIPNYPSGDTNHSKLNNKLCYAQLFETETAIGKLTNGIQRIETPDILWGAAGSQVSAAGQEPWHYWHFLFRENAETIPFDSDFKQIRPGVTHRTMSEGTQLFAPVLSSSDMYWQNRQCPATVDYLPWTFGASLYACPSEHFDIPYYAAIKKFGFYGTRFLNSCTKLSLTNEWSGVSGAVEVPTGVPIVVSQPDTEPDGIEEAASFSFSSYDNLLRIAKAEERYSNMYAMNKGFFLWANSGCITSNPDWAYLVYEKPMIGPLFTSLINQFQAVYVSGLSSFISGEPHIVIKQGDTETDFTIVDSGRYSDLLFTNDAYTAFKKELDKIISGNLVPAWERIESQYAYFISNCSGQVNEDFYSTIASGREKRLRTRYFENIVRGNPIDLFPLNSITFATDTAKDFLESTGWGRSPTTFGKGASLPPITRRFFEGAYGKASAASGLADRLQQLSLSTGTSFYPGFFGAYNVSKELPTSSWIPVLDGVIQDVSGRRFSPSGWLAAGYNEIGALDGNFSCFTPIFVQQPLSQVFCKIGQHPTLRALAVDYHSIPEDKISARYPEILYWTHKLKLNTNSFRNAYPLKYKWFRVHKKQHEAFARTADFSLADFSNPQGDWCALEGDQSTCTFIHPKECFPPYDGNTSEDYYTFIKGVDHTVDDQFYYYCLVIGRFGVRISEPTELVVEDWLRFDVSHKNGMNVLGTLSIKFKVTDIYGVENTITFVADESPAYRGYQLDVSAIPESVVEQKIPPPNAGFGDVSATRFIGPNGYVGATVTYAPDTLKDTRGVREAWGRLINFGSLVPLSRKLSQTEGDLLYGYKHLPTCENYTMARGKKGIKVEAFINNNRLTHWSLGQKAYAATDGKYGMQWDKIGGVGSLYPPCSNLLEMNSPSSIGAGHWQWGNNLGAIKRFGWLSRPDSGDLTIVGPGQSSESTDPLLLKKIKEQFIHPNTLAGNNCGYTNNGLGRNMLYYIEAYDRFYLICDPIKKKNVANKSFMCPGLRFTNSAIQYFWMGQPSNTYVERHPMYGPYAYQWRMRRHNRDRNGNGISQGFYSMNFETRYQLMYDAPAIYGLYLKREPSAAYKGKALEIKELRKKALSWADLATLRTLWFGECGEEGTCMNYGSIMFSCDPTSPRYNKEVCDYVEAAKSLANTPDFSAYSCPEDRLKQGDCFDPCLSMRYGQGMFPGGKSQNMFGYASNASANLKDPRNIRLVSHATFKDGAPQTKDERSVVDSKTYFRSTINTPHSRIWRGLEKIGETVLQQTQQVAGISPCQDGGSDHCNFITPTVHLDKTSLMLGATTAFNASVGYAASIYAAPETRGQD